MADPFTIGAAITLLSVGLPGRTMITKATPEDIASFAARCCFPMPAWRGIAPTRSQEYRAEDHHGIDVMYPRGGQSGSIDATFPPGTSDGSRRHFCPPGVTIHAVADGYVWASGEMATGNYVTLDHGAPWASFYVHLESLAIPKGIQKGAGRYAVKRGDVLGTVGWSPRDAAKLRHLHLELWYKGGSAAHVDPWAVLAKAALP